MILTSVIVFVIYAALLYYSYVFFHNLAKRWQVLIDYPKKRSSHAKATVRGAGLVIVFYSSLHWILLELFQPSEYLTHCILGALILAIVSFLDDISGLSVRVRLLFQTLAATVFLIAVPVPSILFEHFFEWSILWYPLAIFFIVSSINLYNFMDGIDGMSAAHSMTLIACWTTLSLVMNGEVAIHLLAITLPLVIFSFFNWHPAKLFLGDVGSTFLGYTFSCFAITELGGIPRIINFIAFVFLMMPFLFDTTFTVLSRFCKGKSIHTPHRDFLFHRLVEYGIAQGTVSLIYASLTAINGLLLYAVITKSLGIEYGLPLLLSPYLVLYTLVALRNDSAPQISSVISIR